MLLNLCVLLASVHLLVASRPIVETRSGKVRGREHISRDGRPYFAWTRIPYAKPPLGSLRLKHPQPIGRWTGILDATRAMPPCTQFFGKYLRGQEDCLYLNIFRPKTTANNLPVLFYVHGGAFQVGEAAGIERGEFLMDEDVILVCVHSRLNGFGFMSLGDKVIPGNFGMKDLVMALKWLKLNIGAFGGNRNSITVFGESSGGASAHLLLNSPATKDLVSRAWSNSGSINQVWSLKRTDITKNGTLTVAHELGCALRSSESVLKCLQKVTSAKLMNAIGSVRKDLMSLPFVPVIEPIDAEDAFATEDLAMRPSNKPWISSVTNAEYMLFTYRDTLVPPGIDNILKHSRKEYLKSLIGMYVKDQERIPQRVQLLERVYFRSKPPKDIRERYGRLCADLCFNYPAVLNMIFHKGPKWFFVFEYRGEFAFRASITPPNQAGHAAEYFFFFNSQRVPMNPTDYAISRKLIKRLVNFAYYNNPTPKGSEVHWNQFKQSRVLRVTTRGDIMADLSSFGTLTRSSYTWAVALDWL